MIDTREFPALLKMAIIPQLPLLGIMVSYFCLVDIPLRKRVIAAMSSIFLLLMIPSAFIIGFVTDSRSEARDVLFLVFLLLPTAALLFTMFTLFYVRTWMNVLQVPNLLFGLVAFYFMVLGPMG